MKKNQNIIRLLTVVVIFVGFYFLLSHAKSIENASLSFFKEALRDAETSEKISVRGKKYNVENGIVTSESGDTIKPSEELDALKATYALTMARRSPLFGIAGTNPNTLKQTVDELKNVVEDLAKAQDNPRDATMVASSLYPIDFLYSLSALEENRLKLLASGTNTDSDNYEKSLRDTIRAGKRDIENFKKSFQKIIGAKSMRFLGLGGAMTTESMLETISLIQEGISRNENILLKRNLCISGKTKFCDKTAIEIPAFRKLITNLKKPSGKNIPPLIANAREILMEASGRPIEKNDILVVLERSNCLGALPGPYYLWVRTLTDNGEPTFRIFYAEDLFFLPRSAEGSGTMNRYQYTKLGVSFSLLNPTVFYMCPEIGSDISRAYGTLATTAFAKEHPSLAVPARNLLLESSLVTYGHDAALYIQTALAELKTRKDPFSEAIKKELANLTLMFNERSAGLEFIVEDIVKVNSTDLHLKETGVPFDVSARTLFLTHSAFPSLFLSQNPSAGAVNVRLHVQNKKDQETLFSGVKRYSDLRLSVPHEKIVSDIRAFLKMEGKLFSQRKNQKNNSNEAEPICNGSIDLKCLTDEFIEKVKILFEWNQYAKLEKCGIPLDLKCAKEVVVAVVSTNGLDAGFRIIKGLYDTKPRFRPFCHKFAMDVGAAVYQKFPDYTKLSYTPLSVTCNYGFYQEYPRSLLLATGDIKKAKEFCEYVGKELGRSVPAAEEECFRGIGRGLPFIDKSSIGDTRRMAKFATDTCKDISSNQGNYGNCLSGAFNQLARETVAKNYGLAVNESDPLWLCKEQSKEIQLQCYGNFKWVDVPKVDEKNDVPSAFKSTIDTYATNSSTTARSILWTIAYKEGIESTAGNISYDGIIQSCAILPSPFQTDCVVGFSVGLAKHSFPGRQHEAVIDFCQKVQANEALKTSDCASQAIEYLRGFYSPDQSTKMCSDFKKKLGVICE